jgi:DNA-binding beta-propeller fold protein YncE
MITFGGGPVMARTISENYPGRVRAVPFPGKPWLNTQKALTLADFKGKVLLLDFWTYCCINCLHVLPDLHKLEERFPRELAVVGVHSAKFENEKVSENIQAAIKRYQITHPVINDDEMLLWRQYGVSSWPTLVVIDPEGYVVGMISGEGHYDALEQVVMTLIKDHAQAGTLKRGEISHLLEPARVPESALAFPGKVVASADGQTLYLTDTNHNRVLAFDAAGKVQAVFGSGTAGWVDGQAQKAQFRQPQGLALLDDQLYVADTENHLIRKIDLKTKIVSTIAGTGAQVYETHPKGAPLTVNLNSPWDVYAQKGWLYIAMAGPHQIWAMDLIKNEVFRFAGTGREDIIDGLHATASFAQPSGLASDGTTLFVADSEVSAVRAVDLNVDTAKVSTLVGKGLFDFGDIDGPGNLAKLQHPLGVAWHDGLVYVADTYNHKIKTIDPKTRLVKTLAGDGKAGLVDGAFAKARFFEPSGLTFAAGKLYVTDTNNQAVRVLDLEKQVVSTLSLTGIEGVSSAQETFLSQSLVAKVSHPENVTLQLKLDLPKTLAVNEMAPHELLLDVGEAHLEKKSHRLNFLNGVANVKLALPKTGGILQANATIYLCEHEQKSLCFVKKWQWSVKIEVVQTGDDVIVLPAKALP